MVSNLIFEYFCRPIIDSTIRGYNPVNTAVYALILFLCAIYFIYPFLKRNNIKTGIKFMVALLPYIVFGSGLRVLNDIGFFSKTCNVFEPGFYTFTPGIWILTALIAITGILVSKKFSKNDEQFYKYFGIIGLLFAAPIILYEITIIEELIPAFLVIALTVGITFITKFLTELKYKEIFTDKLNILFVAGQGFDGSATYVATDILSCGEQHPLSATILSIHPALFILVKVIIAVIIIYLLEKDIKDSNFKQFVKIAAIILGFATGTRDLITLAVGTCS